MKKNHIIYKLLFLLTLTTFISCSDDNSDSTLKSDCIKRTISPNIVGGKIEFVYAMAITDRASHLKEMKVESSLSAAEGTYIDPVSHYTDKGGLDKGVLVAEQSKLDNNACTTTFSVDTCAASLRYYYVIPQDAKGKDVSFTFTATSSDNSVVRYKMGPYKISKMDLVNNIELTSEKCYISLSEMKAFSLDEINSLGIGSKIDVVFDYNDNSQIGYNFVSPSSATKYIPSKVLPKDVNNVTAMVKTWNLRDQQLANLQYGEFIDDLDFIRQSFDASAPYYNTLKAENGVWVENNDKSLRGFIYVNKLDNTNKSMTISIKCYKM